MVKPVRLLVFAPEYRGHGGGIGTYYRALLPALARFGCDVTVIEGSARLNSIRSNPAVVDGVSIETVELGRVRKWESRFPVLKATPTLSRSVAASWAMWEQSEFGGGADVVEAADFGLGFVAPLCDSSIPVVMQMHGSQGQIALHDPLNSQWLDDTLALAFETSLALRAAAVQSPSISNAEYWASQMARIVACHRPAWAPEVSRSEQGRISQRISVFGRVQRWKGPHILCEALRIMGARAPSVDWYGRDTRFDSSGRMCSQWLAEEFPDVWGTRVVWHSQVPPAQVAEIQSRSLLNLVPSTWDVFNFVCVEAMASGRPLICSSGAGASELVENGVTGFVYENNSPEELAATIERALSLTKMQQSDIGEAARRTVSAALDPNRIATERISDYHAAIAEGSCRKLPEPQAWLQRLCIPGASEPESYAFLDQLPLSSIARYAAVRTLKKLRS